MTSPNRETEAQQVVAAEEQIALTKAKASLRGKRGTIRVNLELAKTTTDQEQQVKMALEIIKRDHREMVSAVALDQVQEKTAKEAALNLEKVIAAASDQGQAERAMLKISKADHQEMEKEAVINQEKVIAATLNPEQVKMEKAPASDLKVQEVQEALPALNHAHSKKAVQEKSQEMKAAVM